MRHRGHDDHKPLVPHPEVDEDREGEKESRVPAKLLREEQHREDRVARQHDPGGPPPLPEDAIPEVRLLDLAATVPRDEELGDIRTTNHERREEAELRRRVEHVERHVALEIEPAPYRDDDR